MFLLLGDPQDSCCLGVRTALEERGCATRIIANPLAHPARFTWRLNNEKSSSQLVIDQTPLRDEEIAGVLVRSFAWMDPTGWQLDDFAYMQAETQAALLGWLWSLSCPVINRYPSTIWYRPKVSFLCWQWLLRYCELPTLETLVTNLERESLAFGQRLAKEGVAGAVYAPLTSDVRYIVADNNDWAGLTAMQRCAPVCLAYPHGAAQFVCVVGKQVVWESERPSELAQFEPALRRFANATGLAFVEFAFAATSHGAAVIAVDPHPQLDHFGEPARNRIVEELVQLLTAEVAQITEHTSQFLQGSVA